jgi:transcriptional regulator GlxA family with amidase domain
LESIAQYMDMSPRNLTRLFKKECGMSPMSYVNDARIDVARRYLETTDLSYKEIAQRCGLESVEALRRIFVRRLNITPPEYRERFRSLDQQVIRTPENSKPSAVA